MSAHSRERRDDIWYLNFDGLCEPKNPGGVATYGVVVGHNGETVYRDAGLAFAEPWSDEASNNVAEYSALIKGLEWLKQNSHLKSDVVIRGDSNLIINQLAGKYKVKAPRIIELYQRAAELFSEFEKARLEWVDRSQNQEADLMSRIAYAKYMRDHRKASRPRREL